MHSFFWCNKTLIPLIVCIIISNLIQIGVSDCSTNNRYCDRFTWSENQRTDDGRLKLNRRSEIDSFRRIDRDAARHTINRCDTSQERRENREDCEFRIREEPRNRVLNVNSQDHERNIEVRSARNNNALRHVHNENIREKARNIRNEDRLRVTRSITEERAKLQDRRSRERRNFVQRRLNSHNIRTLFENNKKLRSVRNMESGRVKIINSERNLINEKRAVRSVKRREVMEDNHRQTNRIRAYRAEENRLINMKTERIREINEQTRRNDNRVEQSNRRAIREEHIRGNNYRRADVNRQGTANLDVNRASTEEDIRRAERKNGVEQRLKQTRRIMESRQDTQNIRTRDISENEIRVKPSEKLVRSNSRNTENSIRISKDAIENKRYSEIRRDLHETRLNPEKINAADSIAERRERNILSSRRERTDSREINQHRRFAFDNEKSISRKRSETTRRTNGNRERRVERIQIVQENERTSNRENYGFDSYVSTSLKTNMYWYMLQLLIVGFVTLKIVNKQSADCKKSPFLIKINSSLSKLKFF